MPSVNKVLLVGHLGADPELKYGKTGLAYLRFRVATSEKSKSGGERVYWHNVVVFGKGAERLAQSAKKGNLVFVEGRLTYYQFEADGATKTVAEILAERAFTATGREERAPEDDLPF